MNNEAFIPPYAVYATVKPATINAVIVKLTPSPNRLIAWEIPVSSAARKTNM